MIERLPFFDVGLMFLVKLVIRKPARNYLHIGVKKYCVCLVFYGHIKIMDKGFIFCIGNDTSPDIKTYEDFLCNEVETNRIMSMNMDRSH